MLTVDKFTAFSIVVFSLFVLFPVGLVHCLTSKLVHALSRLLDWIFGEGGSAHFEGLIFKNSYQPLPEEVIIRRHVVPGTFRSLYDGAWVRKEERLRVERDFYRLVRDHADQKLADFIYIVVRATVEAYQRAEPGVVSYMLTLDEDRKLPRMVRTEEQCAERTTEELSEEIHDNASDVGQRIAPILSDCFAASREEVSSRDSR